MRAVVAASAVAGLFGLAAFIVVSGHSIGEPAVDLSRDAAEPGAAPILDAPAEAPNQPADAQLATSAVPSEPSGYERIAPREPLSTLSLALPPEPEESIDWEGTLLHRAVAPSAGLIEAQGRSVTIAGTEIVGADEQCDYGGRSWNCGLRARTAFRGLLRGRSPICALPPGTGEGDVTARCRIGKQDLGEWLVSNGWARAAAGGPYAEAEARAREKRLGIFGAPPDTSRVLVLPDALPGATPSIEYVEPAVTPPVLRQEPSG